MTIPTNPSDLLEFDSIIRREDDPDTIIVRFKWKFPFKMVAPLNDRKDGGILSFKNHAKNDNPK